MEIMIQFIHGLNLVRGEQSVEPMIIGKILLRETGSGMHGEENTVIGAL